MAFAEKGYERAINDIGAFHEMADGDLIYDHIGYRKAFVLRWHGLTNTERTTIQTRYLVKSSQSFEPPNTPDEANVNVFVVPKSWRESYIESGGTRYYNVEIALEAVTAA